MKTVDTALLVMALVCVALGVTLLSSMWLGTPDLGLVR